jgi:ketosteroid isomerase-like protein
VSAEAVRVVERLQQVLTTEDVVAGLEDPEADARIRRTFMELAEPDFQVVMVGPEYSSARLEFTGVDGFRAAWKDWTSAFRRYRIEIEDMIDSGEQVVSLVSMTGEIGDGDEISAPGAAVWTLVDGRLRRVEFHLDRDAALRAAGIDPSSLS